MKSLHDVYVPKRIENLSTCIYIYIYVCVCVMFGTLNRSSEANSKTAKWKSTTHPVSGQVTRAKQDREQNIVQISRALHRAMSKHDPVHAWARTTRGECNHKAEELSNKQRGKVCELRVTWVHVSCVVFRFWKRWDTGMWWWWQRSSRLCLVFVLCVM